MLTNKCHGEGQWRHGTFLYSTIQIQCSQIWWKQTSFAILTERCTNWTKYPTDSFRACVDVITENVFFSGYKTPNLTVLDFIFRFVALWVPILRERFILADPVTLALSIHTGRIALKVTSNARSNTKTQTSPNSLLLVFFAFSLKNLQRNTKFCHQNKKVKQQRSWASSLSLSLSLPPPPHQRRSIHQRKQRGIVVGLFQNLPALHPQLTIQDRSITEEPFWTSRRIATSSSICSRTESNLNRWITRNELWRHWPTPWHLFVNNSPSTTYWISWIPQDL